MKNKICGVKRFAVRTSEEISLISFCGNWICLVTFKYCSSLTQGKRLKQNNINGNKSFATLVVLQVEELSNWLLIFPLNIYYVLFI